jgi:hypothetical protein
VLSGFAELRKDIKVSCAHEWLRRLDPPDCRFKDLACSNPTQRVHCLPWRVVVVGAAKGLSEKLIDVAWWHWCDFSELRRGPPGK